MTDFLQDLLVVIVKYNRSLEECESFNSLKRIVRNKKERLCIFVYDNSKTAEIIKTHEDLTINYLHDADNSGVSRAYNTGAAYAAHHEKKWILLLDQDTSLPDTILDSYYKSIIASPDIKLFAPILKLRDGRIFSPSRYRFKRGFHIKHVASGIHSLYKLTPVNSGILVDVKAFLEIGGYNDSVKLDFSDFQFIERFRKKNTSFSLIELECEQDFSDEETSFLNQLSRFRYYCEGAVNISKDGLLDWAQYYAVVLVRAIRLTARHKKKDFLIVYLEYFFKKVVLKEA